MTTCAYITDPATEPRCAAGVDYLGLAGGGVHRMVMRLPCVPISNRRGEVAKPCAKFCAETKDEK